MVYRLAVENGKIEANLMRSVKRHRANNARDRFLSLDEEQALRAKIRELYPDKEAEFDLAMHTGMRAGEQYGFR